MLPIPDLAIHSRQRGASGSAVGIIGEVITDGVRGVLVEPGHPKQIGEALTALVADEARRLRLGAAAPRPNQRVCSPRLQ
jgi:glycosyltransferase involved in cell wall biosynthesis